MTELTPSNTYAWLNLAKAAAFNGDSVLADTALWKAIKLEPSNSECYKSGLQLNQPKWYGNPDKLAILAVSTTRWVRLLCNDRYSWSNTRVGSPSSYLQGGNSRWYSMNGHFVGLVRGVTEVLNK